MTSYTIGQVAERSGFSASALRFYEQHGLIEPVDRTPAGYRLYDESSVERLAFIARAKALGCSLDEIADLAGLWVADDCGPVQRRLHELVTDKITDAERRGQELRALVAQLRVAAGHLGGDPIDGACSSTCACVGGTGSALASAPVVLEERDDPDIVCTLPAGELAGRTGEWRRLLEHVVRREPLTNGDSGVRLVLGVDAPLDELPRLAAAEQGCCAFFSFTITVDRRGLALEVRAPDDAGELVDELFGTVS